MEVSFSNSFKKYFRKKIKGTPIEDIFWKKTEFFITDPYHLQLKTLKLSGKLKTFGVFPLNMISVWYSISVKTSQPKRS